MEGVLLSSPAFANLSSVLTVKSSQNPSQSFGSFHISLKLLHSNNTANCKKRNRSPSFFNNSLSPSPSSSISCISSSTRPCAASTALTFTAQSSIDGNQRHWMVAMEAPPEGHNSKPEVIDYYVKTLERVLGSEKEAQMCIYNASCDTHYGFACHIDEETSRDLARLPGVLSVRPDPDFNSVEKDYSLSYVHLNSISSSHNGSSLLFPNCNSKHWIVRIDKPTIGVVSKAQVVDYCVQTLIKVLGNEKDAQMCIYHISWQSNFGFCCELDDERAQELAGLPAVLSVQPDENFESDNKDYNGKNSQNSDSSAATHPFPIKTKKLFIAGLSFYTSEKTLRAAFEGFGELVDVKIIMDKISKRSKGYAFVEYTTEEAAAAALKEMNGKIINGWMIAVDVAKTSPPRGRGSQGRHTA